MQLSHDDHVYNAKDFISCSGGNFSELVDRAELKAQMASTAADDEDVNAIADLIDEYNQAATARKGE